MPLKSVKIVFIFENSLHQVRYRGINQEFRLLQNQYESGSCRNLSTYDRDSFERNLKHKQFT